MTDPNAAAAAGYMTDPDAAAAAGAYWYYTNNPDQVRDLEKTARMRKRKRRPLRGAAIAANHAAESIRA